MSTDDSGYAALPDIDARREALLREADEIGINPTRAIQRDPFRTAETLAGHIAAGPRYADGTVVRFAVRTGAMVLRDSIRFHSIVAIFTEGRWFLTAEMDPFEESMSTAEFVEALRSPGVVDVMVATEWERVL